LRTLLVNPPYAYSEIPIIPLGLSYIAAILEREGHEVEVLDLLVSKYSHEKIEAKLKEYQPDIVGTTSVTMNYPIASDILRFCKNTDKDIITIIGGSHVTFCPEDTLTEAPWIDIVIMGEGDQTILDIVRKKPLESVGGIAYKSNGIKITHQRELIKELDSLPFPARHLFPLSKYLALECHCSLVTGRGCPFSCIFCVGSKMGGRRVRFRKPELIVDEIELALSYGFKEMNMEDDLLTLNHKHVYAFCNEVMKRGLKFNWSIFSRADTVNTELLRKMKKAGCNWMLYGVESGNQHILDTVKKNITLDKIREGVRLAKEADIKVMASFIIGLPGETRDTLRETIRFGIELDTSWGFNVLSPFPGTEVREKAQEYGVEILTNDWTMYDANRIVSRTKGAGPEEIEEALKEYNNGLSNYLRKLDLEGSTEHLEQAKTLNRRQMASALLQNDIIENLGPVENNGDPVSTISSEIGRLLPYTQEEIMTHMSSWLSDGLLVVEQNDTHVNCRWA